jgi:hypothetical protein
MGMFWEIKSLAVSFKAGVVFSILHVSVTIVGFWVCLVALKIEEKEKKSLRKLVADISVPFSQPSLPLFLSPLLTMPSWSFPFHVTPHQTLSHQRRHHYLHLFSSSLLSSLPPYEKGQVPSPRSRPQRRPPPPPRQNRPQQQRRRFRSLLHGPRWRFGPEEGPAAPARQEARYQAPQRFSMLLYMCLMYAIG